MSFRSRLTALASALLASATCIVSAPALADTSAARTEANERPPVHQRIQVNLTRGERGRAALAALQKTGRIAEWSAGYGMSRGDVEAMFNRDPRAYVDKRGALKFVEHIDFNFATPPTLNSNTPSQTTVPTDVFALHSRPNSPRKLYLDFNGHVTQGTAWNDSYGVASINSPAFDLDGFPGTFSTAERQAIFGIWQRVKEDFSPFDIDVTTEEPPADQMTRSNAQDNTFGMRVVITRDFTPGTAEGACQCGGFAYVGVYSADSEYYKPAFVFYDNLASTEKFIAEAATHEAGHTMGLAHDGRGTLDYYEGHGTGVTGWAPIMGVGYSKLLTQWSKGEYGQATNRQDDYLVMQNNGVRFAADDHGNTLATATVVSPVVANGLNRFTADGVLQGPTDIDIFRIETGTGLLTINVSPDAYDPNVDVLVTLLNANGTQVSVANPLAALNASLSFTVATAGTYYVSVRGTGNGNPATTGYSAYGSVGSYKVDITAPLSNTIGVAPVSRITAVPAQGAIPLSVTFSGATSSGTGNLTYAWSFGDGTTATGATPPAKIYTRAGNFTVTLRVTDAQGRSNSASTTVRALAPPSTVAMGVSQFAVTGVVPNPSKPDAFARASITVRDAQGRVVPNATVLGTWSGIVSGQAGGVTNAAGQTFIASPSTPFVGTFNFTVNNITAQGFVYQSARNVMTSRSINF